MWFKSRDPKFLGKRFEVSSKLFELETSNLVISFAHGMPTGCINNFPQRRHDLGHVTPKILANIWHMIGLIKFANKTANIKHKLKTRASA